LSPRFVANFRAAASEASNPVRFVRVAYDTIFAVVENAVSLLDCTGRPLGSMMQGRGMGLEGTSAPYTFRKERSDDDDEPKGQSDVMPRTLTTVPTLSRLKRSMSVFRPCKAAAGFTVMRDSEYNELCLSAPEYDEQFLAADFDDAALVTPPPSARDATKQVCRFSRPMSPMTIDASSEKNLPYFLQLKSSTADSSARMPGVRCTIDCPEVEDETVAERVLDKLEDLDEEGARYIYLRPPLNRLKAPTTVEIFSGAPSCELNWKLAVQQRPLVNRVVSRDVLSFRPTQIVAPSAMLECLALKSLTRSSHSLEPAVSMSASPGARLGSGRFVRFQKKEGPPTSAPVKRAEPTLDHFVLPASPLLVPRSAAQKLRDKVIQSLSLTPETELASQPGRPLTPLKDICNSESAMMARAATSASRPKPLSFVFGFGQSLTTASRSSTPSWQAARKTVVQRSASALPQACQRAELSLGQPPGQPRVRGQASGYAKRQEYLQLLLHLPRMRKPVANAERLDLVRRL
jgi:hypothetical protein